VSERPLRLCSFGVAILVLVGCGPSYSLVSAGDHKVGKMRVAASTSWSKVSGMLPYARKGTQIWTQDGWLLDRLILIPDVRDGEPLFKPQEKSEPFPLFRAGMLPNELAELFRASLIQIHGPSSVTIDSMRLQDMAGLPGLHIDFRATLADAAPYSGLAGLVVKEKALFAIIYLGLEPYYAGLRRDAAAGVIRSVRF